MLRPERWQIGLAGLLLLAMAGAMFLLHPESTQQDALREDWKQLQASRAGLWQSVRARQTAISLLEEKIWAAIKPFSPVDFQRPGAELVRWTPAGRGGEMVLETVWEQVPSVFTLLAERGMRVSAFSIRAGATQHTLTLQLESQNEN